MTNGSRWELFFQKHGDKIGILEIRKFDLKLWPKHRALLEIPSAKQCSALRRAMSSSSYLDLNGRRHRPARSIDLRPRSRRRRHVHAHPRRSRLDAHDARRAWFASLAQNERRKGVRCRRALAPDADYDTVNAFSKTVVRHIAKTISSRFVAVAGGGNRVVSSTTYAIATGATKAGLFPRRGRDRDWAARSPCAGTNSRCSQVALTGPSARRWTTWRLALATIGRASKSLADAMAALDLRAPTARKRRCRAKLHRKRRLFCGIWPCIYGGPRRKGRVSHPNSRYFSFLFFSFSLDLSGSGYINVYISGPAKKKTTRDARNRPMVVHQLII